MKHNKLELNHQNQNFVLIMTTDDGGGVLVLVGCRMMRDTGDCYRRLSNIFESFEIFLLPNVFQTHLYAGRGKGGHKSNSRVHPSFI